MLKYIVTQPNVDPTKDRRPTKATARNTLYKDSKSKTHRTINGKGCIARLFKTK